jgi:Bacterial Ig domain
MSRRVDMHSHGPARVAGLFFLLAWAALSPRPASAQSLFVNVTSPADGSTVGGTITVTANATPLALVAGVQFTLDGANLGPEDTSSPYSTPWNTLAAANGSHTLRAVARSALGLRFTSDPVVVTVFNDTTPPTVSITSPTSGSTVTGTVAVTANAADNVGVAGVQFQVDGAALGAEDTTSPYSESWNSSAAAPGTHTLRAIARDAAGNSTTSATVTVTVPDTTQPTVSITSPTSGSTVTGTVVVSANAADNVGVAGVQFQVDGAALGAEDTTSPYSAGWNAGAAAPGTHTLRAIARDAAGNSTTSATVTVTVPDTTQPTVSVTSPANGATVQGTVTLSAAASDNVGVAGVQFRLDGTSFGAEDTTAPYSVAWNSTSSPNGSHTIAAVARDAAGNSRVSATVTVTLANPDTTAPTASITSPSSGATVAATINVSANASDNLGVAGVQFRLDGAALGAEDTSAPYSVAWDTTTAAEGAHTLTAVARDAAGNTGTSPSIPVTVSNSRGDVYVGFMDGTVQRRAPDGTLKGVLTGVSNGECSGLAFKDGILYVPHWYSQTIPFNGNNVARFDPAGNLLGTWGSGYDCNPSSFAFDASGNVYVGQADCTGDILKLDANGNPLASFNAAIGVRGADHIALQSDNCTMLYSNWTTNILRYDVCTNTQMTNFNAQPLPGETVWHLKILPDGGVLAADSGGIIRLDAQGNQVQLYLVPGESSYFTGIDSIGDGTFWANNLATSNIFRFDIQSGAVISMFNTGTPPWTAVGVAVRP